MERKFLGRSTAFGKNQGVVGPESIPKTVAVVVKGEFWDIFGTSQNPAFTTTMVEMEGGWGGYLSRITPIFFLSYHAYKKY